MTSLRSLIAILALSLISFQTLAEIKCYKELRALESATRTFTQASTKVGYAGIGAAETLGRHAYNLISQPNARVGGYGHSVKEDARIVTSNIEYAQNNAQIAEDDMNTKLTALGDCVINN